MPFTTVRIDTKYKVKLHLMAKAHKRSQTKELEYAIDLAMHHFREAQEVGKVSERN